MLLQSGVTVRIAAHGHVNDTGADVKAETFTIVDVQVIPLLKLVLS